MEIYYEINGKKYFDNFLIRQNLGLNKSEIQHLMRNYHFPEKEIIKLQNKKLYSLTGLNNYIETIINENEGPNN